MLKQETETIIRYDPTTGYWYAWSCITKHINAMKKKGWELVEEGEEFAKFKAPSYAVKMSSAQKPNKRSISEEQREAMRQRLAKAREVKNIDKII